MTTITTPIPTFHQRGLSALVVGDDPQFVDFLRLGFEYEGLEVLVASTDAQAAGLAAVHRPDVIVVVWTPPARSGVALTRWLRAETRDTAIILVSARDSVDDRIAALEAGADDVMSKPIAFAELMARTRSVLRRSRRVALEGVMAFEDVRLDRQTHTVTRGGRMIELTPREFELLAMLLRHPRQVLTREALLAHVWGATYCGADNVIEVYIHTLREKLGDLPPRLIQTVRGIGYALRGRQDRGGARNAAPDDPRTPRRDSPPTTPPVIRRHDREIVREPRDDAAPASRPTPRQVSGTDLAS